MIKKFKTIKTIKDIEIKTDIGYVPVKNIMKTVKYDSYLVRFTGSEIKCADNHIFINVNGDEVYAKDLKNGDIIKSKNGTDTVSEIIPLGYKCNMYDIQMQYHHKYYTNDILSHNTTVCVGYLLHQVVFNKEYTVAVLANKGSTSMEILSRLKLMYEELPWFLQVGVVEWNKGRIKLGNKSKVISGPANTSSIRGNSINCVSTDTKITVKNKTTGKVETLTFDELEARIGNSSAN